jgi:hypothetical protein
VTSRWKPARSTALDPDLPRSSSITMILAAARPIAAARPASAYCRRVDSLWSMTCCFVLCRTQITASRPV